MARHWFLGDMAAYVFDTGTSETSNSGLAGEDSLVIPSQEVIFFDSDTGGNQYSDLLDKSGNPVISVTAASDGSLPRTQFPDGVTEAWADAAGGAGPRRLCMANDLGDSVDQNTTQIAEQAAQLALAPVFAYYSAVTASYPQRPSTGAPVWWVGPVAPAFGGSFAVDGLDYWIGPVA